MDVTSSALVLILITLVAGTVNGALGYGFSSITVPVALLFYTNRVLNPALVWVEVVLNAYVLWVNRASVPHVWRRVVPMIAGLAPGVALGTALVHRVQPAWLKLATFIVLLPLILLQAAGFRRPIKAERRVGLLFGGGLGVLYSVTTISGPPLAVMLSNQGFTKRDFRAGLGLVRLAESTFTAVAYYVAGMFSIESAGLLPYILRVSSSGSRWASGHRPGATGDLQARLHELRRLGRGLWHLDTTATAAPHRDQRCVLGPRRSGPDRHLAAVSLLPHQPLGAVATGPQPAPATQ